MRTVLQVNTTYNSGSTGRITKEIGDNLIKNGYKSYIANGRSFVQNDPSVIKIGHAFDQQIHGLITRVFDAHGFGSGKATIEFLKKIDSIRPEIIHLHNIHGYYLHVGVLFDYLKKNKIPVVWTLHDCWAFTGHCTYFDSVGCEKWKTLCHHCPKTKAYPSSYVLDRSKNNYLLKKQLFNLPQSVHIVTPSNWLADHVKNSFLHGQPVSVIHNGVNLAAFSPLPKQLHTNTFDSGGKTMLLGVANTWDKRKGLDDFIELRKLLPETVLIFLVGLNRDQLQSLPEGIQGIERTANINELASLYAKAAVFINPTWQDNFPTTNIEALACGTPVITYNTGGSPEAIDSETGFVVEKGNIQMLLEKINTVLQNGKSFYKDKCRKRAEIFFNKEDRYNDYISLYNKILSNL
ncbi:MAG: glycosyltransferase [Ferruginibacter sp.]